MASPGSSSRDRLPSDLSVAWGSASGAGQGGPVAGGVWIRPLISAPPGCWRRAEPCSVSLIESAAPPGGTTAAARINSSSQRLARTMPPRPLFLDVAGDQLGHL